MNAVEKAVAEELSPSEDCLHKLEQDNYTAAMYILFSCLLQLPILLWTNFRAKGMNEFKSQNEEFNSQQDGFICHPDKVN